MKQLTQQLCESLLGGKKMRHGSFEKRDTFEKLKPGDTLYIFTYYADSDELFFEECSFIELKRGTYCEIHFYNKNKQKMHFTMGHEEAERSVADCLTDGGLTIDKEIIKKRYNKK